jgi:phage tail tape-measure protein
MTDKRIRIILDKKEAQRNAQELDRGVKEVGKSADKTQFSLSKMALAIGAATAALGAGAALLLSNQRNFDKLNASLITATGSAEKAAIAFQAIQNLAATTPYSVEQVTEAFIKLRNLGLDPSEKAIISYGNTAAAMGKDLQQMIEAVADATTFEFERLKEFGIKARQQGDQISFTFQGVTTTINKSATEVENYLKSIGDVNFAGAMEQRAKTLDGAISNLSDSVDALLLAINQSGISEAFGDIVNSISSGVKDITSTIKSG